MQFGCNFGDIGARLGGQSAATSDIGIGAARTRIIGGEHKPDIAIAVPHSAQIGGAREDVRAGVEGVRTEPVARRQRRPGCGHDLHEPHGSRVRHGADPAAAFGVHHAPDPELRDAEALRRFGDRSGIGMAFRLRRGGSRSADRRQKQRSRYGGAPGAEPRAIYQLQKQIGAIYRQELALKVGELGYEIAPGKESMFEIKGVSEAAMAAFSTRSAEIEAALGERGTSREEASAAEKQVAALDTRQAKVAADQAFLVADWRDTADGAGFNAEARTALVREAVPPRTPDALRRNPLGVFVSAISWSKELSQ